jgi:uncharacterized repeat protein (TIGR01451 family)
MTHRTTRALLAACGAWLPLGASALGTAAGTEIRNRAEIAFELDGVAQSRVSNATTLRVLELIDANLLIQTPERLVDAGAVAQPLLFTLTNTGNGAESFALAFDNAVAADDFDPSAPAIALYFDSDESGDLTPADVAYVRGTNDPLLGADESIDLLLVQDIPSGILDGERGSVELDATATTGSGAPGTVLGAVGDGGVDAMLGATGARASAIGRYLVGSVLLSLTKTATVLDRDGGSEPSPGASIVYTVRVSAVGNGAAENALFEDAIPASTSYVDGSLELNGVPLSDARDGDAGEFVASDARVAVNLGDLGAADGEQRVQFTVTIN